jgi:hypothetical protein
VSAEFVARNDSSPAIQVLIDCLFLLVSNLDSPDVIPDFSSVMIWSPIPTRGDRANEEAIVGRADHRVSAGS